MGSYDDILADIAFKLNGSGIKPGDTVMCIPGFSSSRFSMHSIRDYKYGGAGYKDGKVFTVERISFKDDSVHDAIVWHDGTGKGIFVRAVKKLVG